MDLCGESQCTINIFKFYEININKMLFAAFSHIFTALNTIFLYNDIYKNVIRDKVHKSMIEKDFQKMKSALGEAKFLSFMAADEILKNNFVSN
jgi:hypothetical protein